MTVFQEDLMLLYVIAAVFLCAIIYTHAGDDQDDDR